MEQATPETGYAPVNGLQMYYEIHGAGGTPLLLLHGGLFNIDLQFGALLPDLAKTRQVIAADFQGHGRTGHLDRPLTSANLASDVVGLLEHLQVPQVDVFGFSVGGGVGLHLAIKHPELVRKLIVSSASFHPDGDRSENAEAVGEMTVDMIAGTPMEQDYLAKSPQPDQLQQLLDRLGGYDDGFPGWSDAEIEGIAAPTLITLGDCDMVTLDHAVRFLRLRGGDVNGDFAGVPASQLAVFPGTTHFFGLGRTALVLDVVTTFLDAPPPAGWSEAAVPPAGRRREGAPCPALWHGGGVFRLLCAARRIVGRDRHGSRCAPGGIAQAVPRRAAPRAGRRVHRQRGRRRHLHLAAAAPWLHRLRARGRPASGVTTSRRSGWPSSPTSARRRTSGAPGSRDWRRRPGGPAPGSWPRRPRPAGG